MEQPKQLKHYEILSRLGEGGMGVVYRARDVRLGRVVALKVLPRELAVDEERRRRFEREARIASSISHPGIATLYDVDRDDDVAFLTMELVEGSTLRKLLEQGSLPLGRLLDCAVQVAEALAAAHREGVTHRDLKPENVMAAESGYFKVLDFGVARLDAPAKPGAADATSTPTRTLATRDGAVIGTIAYMSPEQALGREVDARSDVFSFGSLLYELATGTPAFHGANEIATAQMIMHGEPEPLRQRRPELPEALELVLRKCLAKDPARRYASAVDLAADLRLVQAQVLSGTRSGERLLAQRFGRHSRRRWAVAALAVALLGALGGTAWWLTRDAPFEGPESLFPPRGPGLPAAAPAAGTPERPRVVVAFFDNNTGDAELEWLGRGLPEMLTTDLSRSKDLEVIATQRLHDLLAASGKDPEAALDRSTATELARWAGADVVIGGSVFKAGGQYRLDAQAYDTRTGAIVAAHKVQGEDLFPMVDELTTALRRELRLGAPEQPAPLRAAVTSSEEAYRHFVRGKSLYDSLRFGDAATEFRRALELDPAFALARLRLVTTLDMAGRREEALRLAGDLAAEEQRLPEPEQLLARGFSAFFLEGDATEGRKVLETLLERFPESDEAYLWLSRGLSEIAGDPLRATQKLRKAIELDPNNLAAISALAGQLAELGAVEDARRLLEDGLARNPEATALREQLGGLATEPAGRP